MTNDPSSKQYGLAGCAKADAMLKRVDPLGISQEGMGDGTLGGAPDESTGLVTLGLVALACLGGAASAVVMLSGGASKRAVENPARRRRHVRLQGQAAIKYAKKMGLELWSYSHDGPLTVAQAKKIAAVDPKQIFVNKV